jgi:WD40 repeat protein
VAFPPDGKRLLSGGEDQTLLLWDLSSGAELYRLSGHTHRLWALACAPDGRHTLSASFDKTLRLWHLPE